MSGETQNIFACVDCYLTHEIGENDSPEPSWSVGAYEHGLRMYSLCGVDIVSGDSESDNEFSWSRCDICGSTLGGARHHLFGIDR